MTTKQTFKIDYRSYGKAVEAAGDQVRVIKVDGEWVVVAEWESSEA